VTVRLRYPDVLQAGEERHQQLVGVLLLVAFKERTEATYGVKESRGEDWLPRLPSTFTVRAAQLLEEMVKSLDDVQQVLLVRVLLSLDV